jgi:hypothetical protein
LRDLRVAHMAAAPVSPATDANRSTFRVHASEATRVAQNFRGKGVHEPARIAALAGAREILASHVTVAGSRYRATDAKILTPRGIAERSRCDQLALRSGVKVCERVLPGGP